MDGHAEVLAIGGDLAGSIAALLNVTESGALNPGEDARPRGRRSSRGNYGEG
jgi:hypothetical protein